VKKKALKISILGTRGVPASYGGFETFAEELGARLAFRAHSVVVYGRRRFFTRDYGEQEYRGIRRKQVPTIMHKYLETPLHGALSLLLVSKKECDVVLLCNGANSPFAWLARIKGLPVIINVDGIERQRSKWNMLGRLWYRAGELCSLMFASRVIADAQVIAEYYLETYGRETSVIPYGAEAVHRDAAKTLQEFNLTAKRYILYVSRLEPENNALGVIQAYKKSGATMPLVVVGDAPYAEEYKKKLKEEASPSVMFTGFQFGDAYKELQSNCLLYIQATEVGGTHPALIEAMAYGNCVIANGTPENCEVLGDAGMIYEKNDFDMLANIISELAGDREKREKLGALAKARANQKYTWDAVTNAYEELFYEVLGISG
jgi:glycosyltransferase involved in cell wall biosynthesis